MLRRCKKEFVSLGLALGLGSMGWAVAGASTPVMPTQEGEGCSRSAGPAELTESEVSELVYGQESGFYSEPGASDVPQVEHGDGGAWLVETVGGVSVIRPSASGTWVHADELEASYEAEEAKAHRDAELSEELERQVERLVGQFEEQAERTREQAERQQEQLVRSLERAESQLERAADQLAKNYERSVQQREHQWQAVEEQHHRQAEELERQVERQAEELERQYERQMEQLHRQMEEQSRAMERQLEQQQEVLEHQREAEEREYERQLESHERQAEALEGQIARQLEEVDRQLEAQMEQLERQLERQVEGMESQFSGARCAPRRVDVDRCAPRRADTRRCAPARGAVRWASPRTSPAEAAAPKGCPEKTDGEDGPEAPEKSETKSYDPFARLFREASPEEQHLILTVARIDEGGRLTCRPIALDEAREILAHGEGVERDALEVLVSAMEGEAVEGGATQDGELAELRREVRRLRARVEALERR